MCAGAHRSSPTDRLNSLIQNGGAMQSGRGQQAGALQARHLPKIRTAQSMQSPRRWPGAGNASLPCSVSIASSALGGADSGGDKLLGDVGDTPGTDAAP